MHRVVAAAPAWAPKKQLEAKMATDDDDADDDDDDDDDADDDDDVAMSAYSIKNPNRQPLMCYD